MAGLSGFFDFLDPAAQRRQKALEVARLLMERQGVDALPAAPGVRQDGGMASFPSPEGYVSQLPHTPLGPQDDLDLYTNLHNASTQPRHVVGALVDFMKERAIQREASRLGTPEQRVMALNSDDVSPVGLSGGVRYDRFSRETPILEESSAVKQLAEERRTAALENVADEGEARANTKLIEATTGLRRVQTRNEGAQPPAPRIKGLRPDGKVGYFDAFIGKNGQVHYRAVTGPDGNAIEADAGSAGGPTAFQQNTQYEAQALGISEADVLRKARQAKVSPSLIREVEQDLMETGRAKYLSDPAALERDVDARVQRYVDIAERSGSSPAGPEAPALDDSATEDAQRTNASAEEARIAKLRKSARQVKTVDEAKALPKGTHFIDPNGVLRVR